MELSEKVASEKVRIPHMRIIIAIIIKQFFFIAAFSFPPFSQRCCRFKALILASQTDGVNSFFATIDANEEEKTSKYDKKCRISRLLWQREFCKSTEM